MLSVLWLTGQSLEEVRRGVPDYEFRARWSLDVPFVATWREKAEQEWVDSLIPLMKENIPGFRDWYAKDEKKRSSSVPKLRGEKKKRFLAGMRSEEWLTQTISACQIRALAQADKDDVRVFSAQRLTDAIPRVECYARMFTHYLIRLMTEGLLPKKNDSGDIDFFLYSTDDDHVIATKEKKWIALANAANFTRRIRKYGSGEAALAKGGYHLREDAAKYGKMSFKNYIEPRPFVRSGKPCFKGTRITVYDILEYLAGGMTEDELLVDFPDLTPQHIRAAQDFSDFHKLQLEPSATT